MLFNERIDKQYRSWTLNFTQGKQRNNKPMTKLSRLTLTQLKLIEKVIR